MKSPSRNFKQQFEYRLSSFNQQGAEAYCYECQGQLAEEDHETSWNQFELRMYDSRIGRWMTTNHANQYHSPYLGMGNNRVNYIDKDGTISSSPKYGEDGQFLGVYSEGFEGDVEIMNPIVFWALSVDSENGVLDHSLVENLASNGIYGASFLKDADISSEALSNIYIDILSKFEDINLNGLYNDKVSIYDQGTYDNWFNDPNPVRRYSFSPSEKKIKVNTAFQSELSSVEVIQSYLGLHEWKGYAINGYSSDKYTHHKAYQLQLNHTKTFHKLPEKLQNEINEWSKGYH